MGLQSNILLIKAHPNRKKWTLSIQATERLPWTTSPDITNWKLFYSPKQNKLDVVSPGHQRVTFGLHSFLHSTLDSGHSSK
jgi:hypothetical protein